MSAVDIEKKLAAEKDAFSKRVVVSLPRVGNIRDYTFLKMLGKGGYGSVYKASKKGGEIVAIKVQNIAEILRKEDGCEKVLNESRFLRACECVFIVKVLEAWQSSLNLALVMEYAPYGDLTILIRNGPATEAKILHYMAQTVCALEYLHAVSLIYCDMKPENCLISERGRIKVGDFGLTIWATDVFSGHHGTTFYMAPEILDNAIFTESVDWWAFGVMIFKLLINAWPFRGPRENNEAMMRNILKGNIVGLQEAGISANAKDLISQLLTKNPGKRIGVGSDGLDRLKKHSWFKGIDFAWLWSADYKNPEFDLQEVAGRACEPDVLHKDPAQDPNNNVFIKY